MSLSTDGEDATAQATLASPRSTLAWLIWRCGEVIVRGVYSGAEDWHTTGICSLRYRAPQSRVEPMPGRRIALRLLLVKVYTRRSSAFLIPLSDR